MHRNMDCALKCARRAVGLGALPLHPVQFRCCIPRTLLPRTRLQVADPGLETRPAALQTADSPPVLEEDQESILKASSIAVHRGTQTKDLPLPFFPRGLTMLLIQNPSVVADPAVESSTFPCRAFAFEVSRHWPPPPFGSYISKCLEYGSGLVACQSL